MRLAALPSCPIRRGTARGVLGVVLGLRTRGPLPLGRRRHTRGPLLLGRCLCLGLRWCRCLGLRRLLSHCFFVGRVEAFSDGKEAPLEGVGCVE